MGPEGPVYVDQANKAGLYTTTATGAGDTQPLLFLPLHFSVFLFLGFRVIFKPSSQLLFDSPRIIRETFQAATHFENVLNVFIRVFRFNSHYQFIHWI